MERITSLTNAKVKFWTSLKDKKSRDEHGLFIAEERHLIEEACEAGLLETLLIKEGEKPYAACPDTYEVSEQILKKVSGTVSANRQIGIVRKPAQSAARERVLLLDEVQDPGNVGTLIRTAKAFGFDSVILSEGCADPYSHKAIRSTQGAVFSMNVIYADLKETIRSLRKNGIPVYGTSLKNAVSLEKIKPAEKAAILLGNEGKGVKPELLDLCDQRIVIPMDGFESLNVAVAGGILAYYFRKA